MPGRLLPLVTHQTYHIFNRGIDRRPTFTDKREYQRTIDTIRFYQIANPPISLSKYLTLKDERRKEILSVIEKKGKLVDILSFCLMPNHFHILLQQQKDKGISIFLSNFQNSYTRYFNTKHQRVGPLFLDQFKAVRIESDEQIIHVSRYIHLNPYTSFILKSFHELSNYPWMSLQNYLEKKPDFVNTDLILSHFRSVNEYRRFVMNQADYQRKLKKIEHLLIER